MAQFSYIAEKSDGEVYKGTLEAQDRFEVYQMIRKDGGRLVSLEEAAKAMWSIAYWNAKFGSVPEHDKISFARNLGAMIKAGLPLSRALSVIERQTKNPKLGQVVAGVSGEIRRGTALHTSLAAHSKVFSPLMIAMVRAGEEGGNLASSLEVVAEQMERMFILKKKIRSAMIYPCIILLAIVGIGVLMMTQVVPTLAQTFAEMDAELPTSTQVVIGISDFLTNHTLLAIILVGAFFGSIYGVLQTKPGQRGRDFLLLRMPIIGKIVRQINAARTARTLSSLLSSGVDVLGAIDITRDVVRNVYFKEVLTEAYEKVGDGVPLSTTFVRHESLYPAFVGEMMAVGEETGQTSEMLKHLAEFYEDEVDRGTKDMSTVIEPLLMVFIGASVGFFAISMIAPIYQFADSI